MPKTGAGDNRQMLGGMGVFVAASERFVQLHRVFDTHEGIDTDAVAVADEADGLVRCHDAVHI